MGVTTLSSLEFSEQTGRARKAAQDGPVFITDRGCVAHVLLTFEDYQRLTGTPTTIVDMLAMPLATESNSVSARTRRFTKPADLS